MNLIRINLILFLLKICKSILSIVSPDNLANSNISHGLGSYGNPSIYSSYGKLVFYSPLTCDFSESFSSHDFVVVNPNLVTSCKFSDLVYSVQKSGGIASLIVAPDSLPGLFLHDSNADTLNEINILVLSISSTQNSYYQQHQENEIWVTYTFDFSISTNPLITYYLTSNYIIDKSFFIQLKYLNNNLTIPANQFSLLFYYQDTSSSSLTDCINTTLSSYCIKNNNNTTGKQQLSNSAIILNYFYNYKDRNADLSFFINFVLEIYEICEYNYSTTCISDVFQSNNLLINASSEILANTGEESPVIKSVYKIGDNILYWNNYLELLYCMISLNHNCELCNSGCTYEIFNSSNSCNYCNTSNCGYSNLKCLKKNNCYTFISDGCCLNTSDCNNTTSSSNNDSGDSALLTVVLTCVFGSVCL